MDNLDNKILDSKISFRNNYEQILKRITEISKKYNRNPNEIKVLAVSKTHNYETIIQAIQAGIPILAENYAQEFRDKNKDLMNYYENQNLEIPKFEWHFIGHLQANKVKYLVPFVTTIHTVDSINLAEEINKYAEKYSKIIDVLIQINTSNEAAKSGVEPEDCTKIAKNILLLKNINLIGLMTIGTFSEDEKIIRKEFTLLRNCLNETNFQTGLSLKELSMGMSHDFEIAIEEQATMLRIGTAIFGQR
jgi:pyridoxal phosphate enzyme (YggS family)